MIQACDSSDLSSTTLPLRSFTTASSAIDTTPATTTTTTPTNATPVSTVSSLPDGFTHEDDTASGYGSGEVASVGFDASSTNLESQYPPDVKSGFDELCPVCGDKVSGYHYGLLTCESCKGFFKRTVQNKKIYSCVDSQQCPIDKSQRKRCPYCRFQKCLNVGMKLEAVRQDRMRGGRNKFGPMYKRDRAMKQQQIRAHQRVMSECEGSMQGSGGAPGSPPDIKPDPALLQASLGLGFSPNHTDISSMAAAMAAAVVGASGMDGLMEGIPTTSIASASSGSSYISLGHGHHAGRGGVMTMIDMDEGSSSGGALNLHSSGGPHHHHQAPQTQPQHNGLQHPNPNPHHLSPPSTVAHHHHQNSHHQVQSHHQTLQPHQQQQQQQHTQPPPLENAYLLPQQSRQQPLYQSQTSDNGSTSSSPPCLDSLRGGGGYNSGGMTSLTVAVEHPTLPSLLCDIKANLLDEEEMKHKMLSFLNDTLRQMDSIGGVGQLEDLLHIICRMVDQLLFLMVEWARNSPFFKEIRVEDQMKLLQHSWSEILILDFVYRQVQDHWGEELQLTGGPQLNFDTLDSLGLGDVRLRLFELIKKSRELKLDYNEYMCLKFLILLNSDISSLENRQFIEESQEKVNAALLEYCLSFYAPHGGDKFSQLLLRLPEIRIISIRLEEFLYVKHLNNQVPDQTLLTEMLHSRRK